MKTTLRLLREKSGMSLTGLALKIGLEPSLLSLIERGKHTCRENAERIAQGLGVAGVTIWPDFDKLPHKKGASR